MSANSRFLNLDTDGTLSANSDEIVPSQKAIKTYVDVHSIDIDNKSITENSNDELQTVGVIDQNSGNAIKKWVGTKAQYDAIDTKDANTIYIVTDEDDSAFLTVDSSLSSNSENPVQNKVIKTALDAKQDTISDLSTIRSGAALGATAVQPGSLATVATSGSYNDLSDKPTIPVVPTLATVATSGSYTDLNNKPTIPDVSTKANTDLSNVTKPHIIGEYLNGTSWYRVYSDGWCEQGGALNSSSSTTITFLKPFINTNYYIAKTYIGPYTGTWLGEYTRFYDKTRTSIKTYIGGGTDVYVWEAKGYIA